MKNKKNIETQHIDIQKFNRQQEKTHRTDILRNLIARSVAFYFVCKYVHNKNKKVQRKKNCQDIRVMTTKKHVDCAILKCD